MSRLIDNQPVTQRHNNTDQSRFFNEEDKALIVKVIKRTLYHISEKLLGQDCVVQMLRNDRNPVRPSGCSKCGRLHLKEIINKTTTPTNDNKRVTRSAAQLQENKQRVESAKGASSA